VGASASGVQPAEEIQKSGRQVTLSVGPHSRVPRTYRGRDILHWLDRLGVWSRKARHGKEATERHEPSLQLVGSPQRRTLDLGTLSQLGVELVGSLGHAEGSEFAFRDDLPSHVWNAEARLADVLNRIDYYAAAMRLTDVSAIVRPAQLQLKTPKTRLNLGTLGIRSVLWATGFRPEYPWFFVPGALDPEGQLIHQGGIVNVPGLYAIGLQFMRRRNSSTLSGVAEDARFIASHIAHHVADHAASQLAKRAA
jgi:putative flavoprotein involved in K+ transport